MILNTSIAHGIHNGRITLLILPATRRPHHTRPLNLRRQATIPEYEQLLTTEQIRRVHDHERKPPTIQVCRIHPHDIRYPILLNELDLREIHAAGFKRREDLHNYWTSEYGREPTTSTLCCTIRFQVDRTDTPRLMVASTTGRGDYTTSPHLAMDHEPEPLSPEDHKRHVQERANLKAEQWKAVEDANREALALHERLRRVQESAAVAGVDIRRQELSILNRIRSLESKVRKLAA